LPIYPSPLKDDGYDVANYVDIHPDYGNLADFKTFVRHTRQDTHTTRRTRHATRRDATRHDTTHVVFNNLFIYLAQVNAVHERSMRVIVDFVPNHTYAPAPGPIRIFLLPRH
jgi:1,4-alpha-glucan branching enzyme